MDYQSETYVSGSFHILYIQVSMKQDLVKLEVVISSKELCSLLLRFHDSRFTIHVRIRDNFTMLPIRRRLVRSC